MWVYILSLAPPVPDRFDATQAYLIFATVFGAALGHFIFGGAINIDALLGEESKGMACH
jgi:copper transporter 1